MSVLDRVHRQQRNNADQTEEASPENGQSITPARKSPVIGRLEFVINSLHNYIEENDDSGNLARFSFVTRAMIEEISEELVERDEETMQVFMSQIGQIIAWIGHGDNESLPENLLPFAEQLQPSRPEIERAPV
jgi:hypothetical protein